ncbi:MAG: DUF4384 domain-containing protein [Planctomycetes bacterium]|nr:DUF4384 domain-containing protein [Planctomycetota bacterium]
MNQKLRLLILIGCCLATTIGCGSSRLASTDGKLIWASEKERPDWLHLEPEAKGDRFLFVGLSEKFATEKEARDNAQRAATSNVVRYTSTQVTNNFQRILTSSGLSTDIIDPTVAVRDFEKQFSSAVARRVKAQEWYLQKWLRKKDGQMQNYWMAYVLVTVPQQDVNRVIKEQLDRQQAVINASKKATKSITVAAKLMREGDNLKTSKSLQALKKYQAAIKAVEEAKSLALPHSELEPLIPKLTRSVNLAQSKIGRLKQNPETVFSTGVLSLMDTSEKPLITAVAKVSFQDTELSSEFGNYLVQKLENVFGQNPKLVGVMSQRIFQNALKKNKISIDDCLTGNFGENQPNNPLRNLDGLIFVHYWDKGSDIEIKIELIKVGQGTLLGTTTTRLAKSIIPENVAFFPANSKIAQQGLKAFARQSGQNKDFKIEVWADKGESAVYQKDEIIKFHFRADKDAYIYLYHMDAAGQVKMLFPNRFNQDNRIKANRVYTIPDETMNFDLKITPPFGAEMLKALASLQPLKNIDVTTRAAFKDIGRITDGNFERVITRGIEAVPQEGYTEGMCVITAIE